MSFKDYSLTPSANTTLGDGTFIGPNMLRNKVRPALQQIAADGREVYDLVAAITQAGTISDLVGTRIYGSRDLLTADLSPAAGLYAFVLGDPTVTNNDIYQKVGPPGSGSWNGPLGIFGAQTQSAEAAAASATESADAATAAVGSATESANSATAAAASVVQAGAITQAASDALAAGTISDLVGTRIYTSQAALFADLVPDDNLYALVVGDATAANNDLYQKNGATTTGSWDGPLGLFAAASAKAQASAADAAASATQAAAYGVGVYETLQTYGTVVLDAGGRIHTSNLQNAGIVNAYETLHADYSSLVLDAGGRVVAAAGSGFALASDLTASTAAINARVNSVVTAAGAPLLNPYGREFLRRAHMRLTKRALGEPTQLIINLIGDSYTHNTTRYSGDLAARLIAKFGDAGGGWCGFGFLQSGNVAPWTTGNQPTYTNGNVRPATYPTRLYGNIAGGYYTNATPDLALATLSATGDAIEQDFPAAPALSGVDLFFVGTADGQIRYQWSGGAWATINVQGTVGATQIAALAGYPAGAGTLRIEWVAGTVKLAGVNLKSAADGVRVNKLAATGSNIGQWTAVDAANFEAGLTALGAHVCTILDGTNSQGASMGATAWGNNVDTLVSRLRAAVPGVDILLTTPPENQRVGNTVPMTAYATEARTRAMNGRIAFYDFQPAFGDPSNPTEYGYTGAFPVFASDLIHPDPQTGGRILLLGFMDCIVPYRGV